MRKINFSALILFAITATIPFLFGAVQPLVQGIYTVLILFTSGTWLICNYQTMQMEKFSYRPVLILIILGFMTLTAMNIPLEIIKSLSPVRAQFLVEARQVDLLQDIRATLSYSRPATLMYCVFTLSLFLFFYFASIFMRTRENMNIILWIIAVTGSLEALYGIVQFIIPGTDILWVSPESLNISHPSGTFTNSNHFAAFLNLCWPLSFVLAISLSGKLIERVEVLKIKKKNIPVSDKVKMIFHRAALPYWATVIMILAVLASGSVSGIVVLVIMVLLCRILIPFPRKTKICFSGVLYLAAIAYGLLLGIQGIVDGLFETIPGVVMAKWNFWTDSMTLLREHLFTGIGTGVYPLLAPLYIPGMPENTNNYAYNEYVELAIELGLPAMTLFFFWLISGMFSYSKSIFTMPRMISKMTKDDILTIGLVISLLGFLLQAVVAGIWHTPALVLYGVLLLAVLYTVSSMDKVDPQYTPERILPERKTPKFIPYTGRKRRYRS